jgi:glycosyltransferase involved in cell wall biosynthesis
VSGEERAPLSVVVPTRDRPEKLEGCLLALNHVLASGDEIVVADSASSDERTAKLAETFSATYVRCDEPGASLARNLGWRRALHDLIAFVDDDVQVQEGWADALVASAGAHPTAAYIATKIGHPPSEFQQALMIEPDRFWIDATTPVPIGHSASVLVRREILRKLDGFDESLGAGGRFHAAEDQDLFDRIFSDGRKGLYEPDAFAIHQAWRDRAEVLTVERAYGYGTGARIAKLMRTDRGRIGKVLKENVWYCIRGIAHALRVRYGFLLKVMSVRLLATLAGFARAIVVPVRDGHFRPRQPV